MQIGNIFEAHIYHNAHSCK